ncbi:MAG: hypothetical protein RLZZ453_1196 [Chlamydiota bacterium]|jgi:hypothetical protein
MADITVSNGLLQQAAIDSSKALFKVQESTSETILTNGKYQEKMAKTMINLGQNSVQQAIKDLKELIHAENEERHASLFQKIFGAILTSIMCVISAVTAQPELAVISIALYAASVSGGTKWAENKIADLLHSAFGLKKSIGRLIGSILIVVVSVAAGAGGRAAAAKIGDLIGSTALKAGAESATTATVDEANTTADETAEEASLKGKASALLKRIPAPLARALTTFGMSASSANLGGNLAAIAHNKKLAEALESIVSILSLLAGLVGGGAMGTQEVSGGNLSVWSTRFLKGSVLASGFASVGQGSSSIAVGRFDLLQGSASEAMGHANAELELTGNMRETGTDQWTAFIRQLEYTLQQEGKASVAVAQGMSAVNAYAAQLMA